VFDYMRCLFWNSPLWTPFESLQRGSQTNPLVIRRVNEGARLLYGEATYLVAWRVKDLRIVRGSSGKVVIEWTAPAGSRIDGTIKRSVPAVVPVGASTRRRYEWDEQRNG